ncbi:MAG: FxLYD domain-containing protein [Planctomycetota bacterium]
MSEETFSAKPAPQGESERASAPEPPLPSSRPAGPAQVVGCWIILIILAGLVVAGVFWIGQSLKRDKGSVEESRDLDKPGIADGSLEEGKAYVSKVSLKLVGLTLEAAASQPGASDSRPAEEGPAGSSEAAPPRADLAQPAYIITGEVQNTGEKTITYLKVHVTLKNDKGSTIGETWVDAATARPSFGYIRKNGEIPPGGSREFQARIGVSPDVTAQDASLDVTHLAVK